MKRIATHNPTTMYGIRLFLEKIMADVRFDEQNALTIRQVGYVRVVRDENYTYEYKKGKELFSFIFVESGAIEYVFPLGERLFLKSGDVLYIPKYMPYKAIYSEKDTTIRILIFDTDARLLSSALGAPIRRAHAELSEIFRSLSGERIRNSLFLCAKIYELLSIFRGEKAEIPKKYARILPAIREIRQNFCESHPLSYYAALCHMSESNLRLLFKEFTGSSLIEYRNRIRITEARKLIDSGEFSVAEAAYLVGFNNMSFFYEQMKAY